MLNINFFEFIIKPPKVFNIRENSPADNICKKKDFYAKSQIVLAYSLKIRDNIDDIQNIGGFKMAFCSKCGKEISEGTVCSECASKENSNKQKSVIDTILDTKDTTAEYSKEEIEKNKVVCGLAYIPILFWLPLVAGTKGSKYCKFHANQGLLLLIVGVVFAVIGIVLGLIPILGTIISILTSLIELGYFLFGLINTIMGKSKELPFIGGIKII